MFKVPNSFVTGILSVEGLTIVGKFRTKNHGFVRAVHSLRPSFGYRCVAHRFRKDTGERVSVKQVLKCMRKLGIQSQARRKREFGIREPHMQFLIY